MTVYSTLRPELRKPPAVFLRADEDWYDETFRGPVMSLVRKIRVQQWNARGETVPPVLTAGHDRLLDAQYATVERVWGPHCQIPMLPGDWPELTVLQRILIELGEWVRAWTEAGACVTATEADICSETRSIAVGHASNDDWSNEPTESTEREPILTGIPPNFVLRRRRRGAASSTASGPVPSLMFSSGTLSSSTGSSGRSSFGHSAIAEQDETVSFFLSAKDSIVKLFAGARDLAIRSHGKDA